MGRRFGVVGFIAALTLLAGAGVASAQAALPTLGLVDSEIDFGETVAASGTVGVEGAGHVVAVEQLADEVWVELGRTIADASGAFSLTLRPTRGGLLRALDLTSGAESPAEPLTVSPRVRVETGRGVPFSNAPITLRVRPATYSGVVSVVVRQGSVVISTSAGRVRGGVLRAKIPTPGVGAFAVVLTLSSADGLAARVVKTRVRVNGRALSAGSTGPDVRALTKRLAELRFHVPAPSATYGYELLDAVIAFQKAYRLERTGVVDTRTWRRLGSARLLRPRYTRPAAHIEVDKTRQILLDVRGGRVVAVLPVSTGATGNTPEGRHRIRWKAPSTTTWLGPGILYRTLTFYGNSFAIHGWSSVPAYPASHGCVRIPIWTADWLYNRSPVGQTVYVYR
jgi:lipoprotein-anchoring transpeptidase ErfK/SrfK